MVATAVGDFANVYNALGQVPNSKKYLTVECIRIGLNNFQFISRYNP